MNPDFVDLLRAFAGADVRCMIVGAYALVVHGRPRATGDLDIWIDATPENAPRVMFIDRASFLRNKRATGRLKDLSDIEGMD